MHNFNRKHYQGGARDIRVRLPKNMQLKKGAANDNSLRKENDRKYAAATVV
jgi:hypothetical protein